MNTRLIIIVFSFLISSCQSDSTAEKNWLNNATQQLIIPWHVNYAAETDKLLSATKNFCANDQSLTLASLQQQWQNTFNGWQQVQLIQLGPITLDNTAWRIQFWPDRHQLIKRKIKTLVNSEKAIDIEALTSGSVVIVGLSAMEYLLFDPQLDKKLFQSQPRYCELLVTISAYSHTIASGLSRQWQQHYAQLLLNPSADNPDFASDTEVVTALLDSMLASLEVVYRNKLGKPLGTENKANKPQPYLTEAWRSQSSLAAIKINMEGLQALFLSGLNQQLLTREGGPALAGKIEQQFEQVLGELNNVQGALFIAVTKEPSKPTLLAVHQQMAALIQSFKYEVPAILGITLGFNANDGD